MDKKARSIAALIAIVAGGALIFAVTGCSSDDSGDPSGAVTAQADAGSAEDGASASTGQDSSNEQPSGSGNGAGSEKGGGSGDGSSAPGEYVEYSPDLVSSTPGTKLLYFHASWCPQCQALESDIEANGLPDGVTVFKVDYDSNQDLRQEYGVTLQTTMVEVDSEGKKIDSYVAYEEPTFDAVERNLLK